MGSVNLGLKKIHALSEQNERPNTFTTGRMNEAVIVCDWVKPSLSSNWSKLTALNVVEESDIL